MSALQCDYRASTRWNTDNDESMRMKLMENNPISMEWWWKAEDNNPACMDYWLRRNANNPSNLFDLIIRGL